MDWTKAKTILIVAFIITNAFLFYNLERGGSLSNDSSVREAERIDDVEELLGERGIFLAEGIPLEMPEVPSLEVAYYQLDEYQEAIKLLGEDFAKDESSYSAGAKSMKVIEGKRLVYEDSLASAGRGLDIEEAREVAEAFLEEMGYTLEDAQAGDPQQNEGLAKLIYVQTVGGLPIENGRMEIEVSSLGVARLDRVWMEVISVGESTRRVIPAAKALLMAVGELEENRIGEIAKMDLTYLFDTKKTSLSKWQEIKSGTALPVWRIDLPEGGGSVYVDAYEGIVIGNQ